MKKNIENILNKVNEKQRQDLLLEKFEFQKSKKKKACMNSLQLALHYKSYKVFTILLSKVTYAQMNTYLGTYELLEQVLVSGVDKQIAEIVKLYQEMKIRIVLASLSHEAQESLYEGSWNQETIKALYPYVKSFLIFKGQKKAIMYATVCYNRFLNEPRVVWWVKYDTQVYK